MEIIDRILESCMRAGADSAEVYNVSHKSLSVSIRDGKVDTIQKATPGGMAIRFISSGKMAFAHSTDTSSYIIDRIIPQLSQMAKTAGEKQDIKFNGAQSYPSNLGIFDPTYSANTIESKIEYLMKLEKQAIAYDPLIKKSNGASFEEYITTKSLANSNGLKTSYDATYYGIGVSVVAVKNGEMYPGDGSFGARSFEDLPDQAKMVEKAASKAVRLVGGTPIDGGDYEIIFTPSAAGSIFWGLAQALNGENAYKGSSFLSGKIGSQIAVKGFSVYDDALMIKGVASRPADDEGVASTKQALIEDGILRGFLYDNKTAAKAGAVSTGSAMRGDYNSFPGISPSNFYIAAGKDKVDDVIASCKKGIIVEDTQGWGLNSVTGQYSAGISGVLVLNGKIVKPVGNITVGASADEVLNGIGAICDDLTFYQAWNSPTLMVKKMRVGTSLS